MHEGRKFDLERDALMELPHLCVAGEQHKRPAARDLQQPDRFLHRLLQEPRAPRIGQMLRHVEQRLLGVVEVAGHNQRARQLHAQPLLHEFERALHCQRGRGHHDARHFVEKFIREQRRNVNRCGFEKQSPPAPFGVIDKPRIVSGQPELQLVL